MATKGMTIEKKGNSILITVPDVTKNFGPSTSGKTLIIATTSGAEKIDGISVNLNVYVAK